MVNSMILLNCLLVGVMLHAQAAPNGEESRDEVPDTLATSSEEAAAEYDEGIYEKLQVQIPDPASEIEFINQQLEKDMPKLELAYYETILKYVSTIDREEEVSLSLSDVIRKALESSYNIRVQSYSPPIAATRLVEAEAVFDTLFFSTANFTKQNTPTATSLQPSDSTSRAFSTGIAKRLPTGMQIQTSWDITRNEVEGFRFATLNPAYRNEFVVSFTQPLLRNFGLDVNRAAINIAQRERISSEYAFRREVREHLVAVERAYWQLVAARRSVVIAARLIGEFQKILDFLVARRGYDVAKVTITDARARLDAQIAQFVRVKNNVKDAEDSLKSLLNDPTLNLATNLEIIPTEFPTAEHIALDPEIELLIALDNRSELKEAEQAIEIARLNVGVSKNAALPRLDAGFRYAYDALGKSQHDAFQNLSDFDFHNYAVDLRFEWPIGNRGLRASLRRARLQHAQAMALLKQQIELVLLDVNTSIREFNTSYEQIGANLTSVESQMEQVRAIEERAESRDPDQLNRELNAKQMLANNRSNLLESLVSYNFAITELERSKGTLLEYNNITIAGLTNHP